MSDVPGWPTDGQDDGTTPPPPPPAAPPPPPAAPTPAAPAPSAAGGAARTNATFGERATALIIDWVVLLVLGLAVAILSGIVGIVSDALGFLVSAVGWIALLGVSIGMMVLGEGGPLGQTPGKHMRGIEVIKQDGSRLDTGGAALRWVGRLLDTIVCGLPIGYLWPLFDEQDRAWHDMVAGTRVVTGGQQGTVQHWFENFRA